MRTVCWTLIASLVPLAAGADQFQHAVVTPSSDGPWRASFLSMVCIPETHSYEYAVQRPVTVEKQVVVNGELQKRQFTEYVTETKTATKTVTKCVCKPWNHEFDPANVAACNVSRRKISTAELKQRIKSSTLVLWLCSGAAESIPEYYATVYKPDTIVILESGGAPHGVPMPAGPIPVGPMPGVQPPAPPREARIEATSGASILPVAFQAPGESAAILAPALPATPAPQIVFVSREGADALKIRQFSELKSTTPLTIKSDDPRAAEKTVMVPQTVRHSTTSAVPLSALHVSTTDGADLTADKVKERYGAGETAALLSADGMKVDPYWLQIVQPRVLVLRGVQFSPAMQHYAAPMAMPPMTAPAAPVPQVVPAPTVAPAPPGAPLPKAAPSVEPPKA